MKPTLTSRLCHWAIPVLLATTLPVTSRADNMDSADSEEKARIELVRRQEREMRDRQLLAMNISQQRIA